MFRSLDTLFSKQIRFLINEFVILERLLKDSAHESEIRRESQRLHRLLSSDVDLVSREEYRHQKTFRKLRKVLIKIKTSLAPKEASILGSLLGRAITLDRQLEAICLKKGTLQETLQLFLEDFSVAHRKSSQEQISVAIRVTQEFIAIVKELEKAVTSSKTAQIQLKAVENGQHLALLKIPYNLGVVLILFDVSKLGTLMSQYGLLTVNKYTDEFSKSRDGSLLRLLVRKEKYFLQKLKHDFQKTIGPKPIISGDWVKHSMPHHGDATAPNLDELEIMAMNDVILGYVYLRQLRTGWNIAHKAQFANAFEIWRIASKKHYGRYFFELVMSYASSLRRPVVGDRSQISPAFQKLLEYFDVKRSDVIKFPSGFRSFHDLLGFSSEEVYRYYGERGLMSSTFDRDGLPTLMTENQKKTFFAGHKIARGLGVRYLERAGSKDVNQVLGGFASLDKSYFYSGRSKECQVLLSRAELFKKHINQHEGSVFKIEYLLERAALSYFMSFKL